MITNFSIGYSFGQENCEDFVIWSNNERLVYDDFKSEQDTTFLTYNLPPNAVAATKIKLCFSNNDPGIIEFQVINKLLKNKSWMVSKSGYALNHEQIHFDISEIFSRKIREKLTALTSINEKDINTYQTAFSTLLQERINYQQLYDDETHHGILVNKQTLWNSRIREELEALEEYSSTESLCECPEVID